MMVYDDTFDTDGLLKLASHGDVEAVEELIRRVNAASYLLESSDTEARHFRLGVMPIDTAKLRETRDRIREQIRQIVRLNPLLKTSGFNIYSQ